MFNRGCGQQFSVYMLTWAGAMAGVTTLFAIAQVVIRDINGTFISQCLEKAPTRTFSFVKSAY